MRQAPWARQYGAKVKEQKTIVGPVQAPMRMMGGPLGSMTYTGLGANGQLDRFMPTDMIQTDQGPKMIHEGEIKMIGPQGQLIVVPANRVPQELLAEFERQGNVGGYALGTPGIDSRTSGATRQTPLGVMTPPAGSVNSSNPSDLTGAYGNLLSGKTASMPYDPAAKSVEASMMPTSMKAPTTSLQTITGATQGMSSAPASAGTLQASPVVGALQTAQSAPAAAPTVQMPSLETQSRIQSNQHLLDTMAGKNPALRTISNQALGDLQARQQWGQMAQNQQIAANPNLTTGAADVMQAQTQARQGAEMAQLEGSIAKNAMDLSNQAANTLYTGSLAGQAQENTENWKAAEAILAGGDVKGYAAKVKEITGVDIDTTTLDAGKVAKARAELQSLTLQFSSYDEAIGDLKREGILDALGLNEQTGRAYWDSIVKGSSPINQFVQSFEPVAATMWPGQDFKTVVGPKLAQFYLTGGVTFDSDGSPKYDTGKFDELFGNVGEPPQQVTAKDQSAYDTFKATFSEPTKAPTIDEWKAAGSPASQALYDQGITEKSFSTFNSTLPDEVKDTIPMEQWQKAGKPTSYAAYKSWYDSTGFALDELKNVTTAGRFTDAAGNFVSSPTAMKVWNDRAIAGELTQKEMSPVLGQAGYEALISQPFTPDTVKEASALFTHETKGANTVGLTAAGEAFKAANVGKVFKLRDGTWGVMTGISTANPNSVVISFRRMSDNKEVHVNVIGALTHNDFVQVTFTE